MINALDAFRIVVCFGLMAVTVLIILHMKARLNDAKSTLLQTFVFLVSLSAFMGTAARIGGDEPLVWYGAPMRAVAVVAGLIYIWKTREEVKDFRAR